MAVLNNVLLATDEGRLRIAATNLDIGITTWIGAAIEREGRITVDARLLSEFVNTLPNAPVQMTVEPPRMTLTVQSGRDKAGINGIEREEHPETEVDLRPPVIPAREPIHIPGPANGAGTGGPVDLGGPYPPGGDGGA